MKLIASQGGNDLLVEDVTVYLTRIKELEDVLSVERELVSELEDRLSNEADLISEEKKNIQSSVNELKDQNGKLQSERMTLIKTSQEHANLLKIYSHLQEKYEEQTGMKKQLESERAGMILLSIC